MTENKRFTILTDNEGYNYTVQDKGIDLNDVELVSLLNNLHEENKQLKQHIQTLQKQTKRLENDNIQTYTLIKEALANERTSIGQSVLKQLMERIQ